MRGGSWGSNGLVGAEGASGLGEGERASEWEGELARRRAARRRADARWGARARVAVWRGTVHIAHGASNAEQHGQSAVFGGAELAKPASSP